MVGRSPGAGGMAPGLNDSLWLNENFVDRDLMEKCSCSCPKN
jgi:hypothetical protein